MRVENAYKIEKYVSKIHIHALDMLVWYILRYYFKFHGIEQEFSKNTGKTLLFTDYVCEGRTKKANRLLFLSL